MPGASPEGTLTVDRRPSTASTAAPRRPSWFVSGVWAAMIAALSWAVAGLVAAMAGVFALGTVLPLWAALAALLWWVSRGARHRRQRPLGRWSRWIRLAAVTVAVGSVVLNGASPGEHLQTGRDGGTYTATAGWLATDGGLRIDAIVGPFDDPTGLRYEAAGFHEIVPEGPLYAQFMHAFPAMLATAELLGGPDLMVRTNALIGGLALLAFYAFAERLMRPWAALVAQVALAANLVFVYFTRAPFSEPLTMLMLFAGLWMLDQAVAGHHAGGPGPAVQTAPSRWLSGPRWAPATGAAPSSPTTAPSSWTTAFVAGLFIGATFLARLDGLVVLLTVMLALLPPIVRGRMRDVAPAALAGIAVSAALAALDLFVFSPFYVQLHVQFLVPLAVGFAVVVAIGAVCSTRPARRVVRAVMRRRHKLAWGLAVLIVVGGVLAYVVRPSFEVASWDRTTPIGGLQQAEGEEVDEARTYAEQSARWLGWYMGVPALAVALLGWAALVRHAVTRRSDRLPPFLLTLSGLTVLYLWMPSITPDHIWADRRFLPVVYPGLILCAAWLLDQAWHSDRWLGSDTWRLPARAGAVAGSVALVGGAVATSAPLVTLHEDAGFAEKVAAACERLGDDAALLLLDEDDSAMHHRMTQPLRAHCGVPAAWAPAAISDERLLELAARADDRTLYVLAEHAESFAGRPVGDVTTIIDHDGVRLEQTLTVPPRDLVGYSLDVLAAPVTPVADISTG